MYLGSKYKFSLNSCNTTIVLRNIHVDADVASVVA